MRTPLPKQLNNFKNLLEEKKKKLK